jgi:hypothetical protein
MMPLTGAVDITVAVLVLGVLHRDLETARR